MVQDEGIGPQHCSSSPLRAVPRKPPASPSPRSAPSPRPALPQHACAEAALAHGACAAAHLGVYQDDRDRGLRILVDKGKAWFGAFTRVPAASATSAEFPAQVRAPRSACAGGNPTPACPACRRPAALAIGTPSPTTLITRHLGVSLFCARSPTTSAPSAISHLIDRFRTAIPHLTDHFRMAIPHLTDCFRIPVLDTSLISSPRHFLPHFYP